VTRALITFCGFGNYQRDAGAVRREFKIVKMAAAEECFRGERFAGGG